MQLKFVLDRAADEWAMSEEDTLGHLYPVLFSENFVEPGVMITTEYQQRSTVDGELQILRHANHMQTGQCDAPRIVCPENRLFSMPLSKFILDDKYLCDGSALADALRFGIPKNVADTINSLRKVLFTYWQIRIVFEFIEKNRPNMLRETDGLIFRQKGSEQFYLATNRLTTPALVEWVSEVPEPIAGNEFGDMFLYDRFNRKDRLSISTDDFFSAELRG